MILSIFLVSGTILAAVKKKQYFEIVARLRAGFLIEKCELFVRNIIE
jgi:hypothetical protein